MKKRTACFILALLLALGICPVVQAKSASLQQEVLEESNTQHKGAALELDPWLCALAGALAVEQGREGQAGAYRPNGEHWSSIMAEYGYAVDKSYAGCNWLRVKEKPTAKDIVAYWMDTPGFRESVTSSAYTHTGVFIYQPPRSKYYYVVQLFARPLERQADLFEGSQLCIVTGEGVNIRSGPGTKYKSLGKLSLGTILSLEKTEGDWASFSFALEKGSIGYVHRNYIVLAMDEELTRLDVPSTDPGTLGEAQATGRVNVRSGPGKGYAKLGQLRRGQRVAVWAIDGNWAQITWTGSQRGYVYLDYLRLTTNIVG